LRAASFNQLAGTENIKMTKNLDVAQQETTKSNYLKLSMMPVIFVFKESVEAKTKAMGLSINAMSFLSEAMTLEEIAIVSSYPINVARVSFTPGKPYLAPHASGMRMEIPLETKEFYKIMKSKMSDADKEGKINYLMEGLKHNGFFDATMHNMRAPLGKPFKQKKVKAFNAKKTEALSKKRKNVEGKSATI
jgi:hypothetical protein